MADVTQCTKNCIVTAAPALLQLEALNATLGEVASPLVAENLESRAEHHWQPGNLKLPIRVCQGAGFALVPLIL